MALDFNAENTRRMNELQLELSRVLLRANEQKLEAGIAAFACIRCARTLLDQYPEEARKALVEVVAAFLRHDDVVMESESSARFFQ